MSLHGTILEKIIENKRNELTQRQRDLPLDKFINSITQSDRDFYQALNQPHTVFILECKKASPSKGLIRPSFNLKEICQSYHHYADAISVLTDETFFQGDFHYLQEVRQYCHQPILCKDFIISEYQVYLARYYGADAILLMLSVLDDETYKHLRSLAHQLNMGVLTEVSNQDERDRALVLEANVIGINNRDLRDLSIDLSKTHALAKQIPANITVISESGIHSHRDIRNLSRSANGFLIGSAIMAQDNIEQATKKILFGTHKICGLRTLSAVEAAIKGGAFYGGLIFAPDSPRFCSLETAQQLIQTSRLHWVGVFRNQHIEEILHYAHTLPLYAVQLHGKINSDMLITLREKLPTTCHIWRAENIKETLPDGSMPHVDQYVFDHGQGGSGKSFNWQLIHNNEISNVLLAGGINESNIQQAETFDCVGLDINSGAEDEFANKIPKKIEQLLYLARCPIHRPRTTFF